jgi:hypothetical protein
MVFRGDRGEDTMREILGLCTRMDELASHSYASMALACDDRHVATVMSTMSA